MPFRLLNAITLSVVAVISTPLGAAEPITAWQLSQPLAQVGSTSPAAVEARSLRYAGGVFTGQADALILELPTGSARFQRVAGDARGEDAMTWRGVLAGDSDHQTSLTLHAGLLAGFVSMPHGFYEIVPIAAGESQLLSLDHDRFPACGGAVPAPDAESLAAQPEAVPTGGTHPGLSDHPGDIDVLVFYTVPARDQAGGTAQIEATAQAAVDAANTAFAASVMPQRFRLVGALETAYVESGTSGTDLSWLRNDAGVNAERDARLADMTSMLVANGGGGCGIGYVMNSLSAGFAASAFQVTARSCAVGNLTYAHEHGHNMAMHHNPENGGTSPAYPFAYGHYDFSSAVDAERFRTVMSYSNPCTTATCPRRPFFSNPAITYMGRPTGIADQRDNARVGNLVGNTVANWRRKTILRHGFDN